jgi:3-oxoadipate enol-lactonase
MPNDTIRFRSKSCHFAIILSLFAPSDEPSSNHLNQMDMHTIDFFTTGDGVSIAYRFDGKDEHPVLLLSNSIATTHVMWGAQIPVLTERFRVLRYDSRGHGQSGVSVGAYSMDRLGWDVIELLDTLNLKKIAFCGLSLGGMVGQWLAIHAPERIERLVLCHTAAYLDHYGSWNSLIQRALEPRNLPNVAETFLQNWFPEYMLTENGTTIQQFRRMILETNPEGLAGSYAAVRDMDFRRLLPLITAPTFVLGGKNDTVTLPDHSKFIAQQVPSAELLLLPSIHLSNVETQSLFERAIIDFLH